MTRFRITDPALLPASLKSVVRVQLQPGVWKQTLEPDEAKIRVALDQPCEECGGNGLSTDQEPDAVIKCPVCHGSGLRQIPGVQRVAGDAE